MPAAPQPSHSPKIKGQRLPRGGSAVERWLTWLAMAGPIGLIPFGPGTWASLVAVLGWHAWVTHLHTNAGAAALMAAAIVFAAGVPAATAASRSLQASDPSGVVIDEIAGQLLAFTGAAPVAWPWAIAGLLFFRLFDITKPYPIRLLERLPGGWGIMADDILAGIYAAAALFALHLAVHSWLG